MSWNDYSPERRRAYSKKRYQNAKHDYASVLVRIPHEDYAAVKARAKCLDTSIKALLMEFIEWGMENTASSNSS